jgi:hypothetical protein
MEEVRMRKTLAVLATVGVACSDRRDGAGAG